MSRCLPFLLMLMLLLANPLAAVAKQSRDVENDSSKGWKQLDILMAKHIGQRSDSGNGRLGHEGRDSGHGFKGSQEASVLGTESQWLDEGDSGSGDDWLRMRGQKLRDESRMFRDLRRARRMENGAAGHGTGTGTAPVPEPSAVLLFGLGSLVAGGTLRRR